jgi:predicted phosphoadenosine phosphosulfate sulfurtransferase
MEERILKDRIWDSNKNVLEASRERISFIFDEFEEIQVSISGGKDSTVMLHLALQEAEKRGRKIEVFFLDQEAEYDNTIKLIREQMQHPLIIPKWYQVPVYMTNSTSYKNYFLYAWGEGEKWMREKENNSIHQIDGDYPKRFYQIFDWLEAKNTNKAYLVGLKAVEHVQRYRAVVRNPGYQDKLWSTKSKSGAIKFYPIYDWGHNSVWRFIYDYNLPYNKLYDLMFWSNYSVYKMRVSNLIHEKSYHCLQDLPKFEPETFDRLCERISGIDTASRYASEKLVFSNKKLPKHYKCWKEFRDFLLENIPSTEHREKFRQRYSKQEKNEYTFKAQVGQLLINDFENSKAFDTKKSEKILKIKDRWKRIL